MNHLDHPHDQVSPGAKETNASEKEQAIWQAKVEGTDEAVNEKGNA